MPSIAMTTCFNPPPARWPGETFASRRFRPDHQSFNPPPARWPGETAHGGKTMQILTEFQSAPGPMAGGNLAVPLLVNGAVGRFNPPPARWPGETPVEADRGEAQEFQSAPGPMAGG